MPDGLRVYAVGDIHGRLDCLLDLERRLERHQARISAAPQELVVFLGDYIDRGPDSHGVIEHLRRGTFAGISARFLTGNHEDALLRFLLEPAIGADWFRFGGLATLASYGVRARNWHAPAGIAAMQQEFLTLLPAAHLQFYRALELAIECDGFLFVHAGIRPGRPLARQRRSDLLEIREPFLAHAAPLPWRVVHGHSIVAEAKISPNKISLDTGAYATGRLSCAIIESDRVTLLDG